MTNKDRLISPRQVAAARALLDWTQNDLATKSGVGRNTIRDYETGKRKSRAGNLLRIQQTIEGGGVAPLHEDDWGGEGVRFKKGGKR